jgi:hypothetical protein
VGVVVAVAAASLAGKHHVEAPLPPPPTVVEVPPPAPSIGALFTSLPLDPGGVPAGLASLSAQGCNACHFEAHDDWAGSTHATAATSPAFTAAVARAADPACTVCHEPLTAQRSPGLDATLALEGVTCAACHVRGGQIVAASAEAVGARAPHPVTWSADLGRSEGCAACHQLTWPGADHALYDTFGEWQASPQAKAGIQCQDCHGAAGAGDRIGHDHAFPADPARAVSVLVGVDRTQLTRGGPPLDVAIHVQNTGAGHAFPTGSPWVFVRVEAALVGPVGKNGAEGPWKTAVLVSELRRTVQDAAPWATIADTRLAPGAETTLVFAPSLPHEAPTGPWFLQVSLVRVEGDAAVGPPFVLQRIPLVVD